MNMLLKYAPLFLIGLSSFSVMLTNAPDYEDKLIGTWKESNWIYEEGSGADLASVAETGEEESIAGEAYKVHKAEVWTFSKGGLLTFRSGNETSKANWSVKGRGNILEIKYDNNQTEHYEISEIVNKNMVLDYECSVQAKGIAKLYFQKSENKYVTQIQQQQNFK